MNNWQYTIIFFYALVSLYIFFKGFYESKFKKNAYGLTRPLVFLGIFVWGDAVVFGLFWFMASLISLFANDWYLFLLITSIFWAIRSLGESIYWFNQQFSTINRNPIKKLPLNSVFHNDSIWFTHQIMWQCITVVSIVLSIYFGFLWLKGV